MSTFHTLPEHKNILGEFLLIFCGGKVEVTAHVFRDAGNEFVLLTNGFNLFKHRLTLMRIDAQRTNHVKQAVSMDIFFLSMATQNEFKLGCSNQFANDMLDIVTHNAFSCGEVPNAHHDNPSLAIRQFSRVFPLFKVFLHWNIFRLPMIGLHFAIEIVSPLVFEW